MALGALPVSLYAHMPWCERKCPYCDFNAHQAAAIPEARYVAALLEDWREERERLDGRVLASAFFGGGTPSLFSVEAIAAALDALRADGLLADGAEVTLEANPGPAELAKLTGWRRAGINRVSLGAQSFDDASLRALGRAHSAEQAAGAVCAARRAGYERINVDLLYGLPAQTLAGALGDLRRAIAQAPDHISWHQLTIEPNTAFHWRRPAELPSGDAAFDMHQGGIELLASHGYRRYELSAFARGRAECRHNRNYWEFGDYIGIGAGAHGKLSDAASGRVARSRKTRAPDDYMRSGADRTARRTCSADDLAAEFMMNALRLSDGCPTERFERRTGLALSRVERALSRLRERGLLAERADRLVATALGFRHLDELLVEFC